MCTPLPHGYNNCGGRRERSTTEGEPRFFFPSTFSFFDGIRQLYGEVEEEVSTRQVLELATVTCVQQTLLTPSPLLFFYL